MATTPENGVVAAPDINRLVAEALAHELDHAPVWLALLHARGGTAHIADPGFLLSLPAFSPRRELALTIAALYGADTTQVCRFPARYLWLRQAMQAPELPLASCKDLAEFRARAPADDIALVFASENLTQPSSMLGHAFLKLEGLRDDGAKVAHAVSFYTDANTYNVPKLLFDSTVIGMPGYFALSPYAEKLQRYVDEEQRPVWEYKLRLAPSQRELIQSHLIELKQTQLTYYFQKYNCATVVSAILSVAEPRVRERGLWNTPRDVLKAATAADMVESATVVTPDRWLIKALLPELRSMPSAALKQAVESGQLAMLTHGVGTDAFVALEAARLYNDEAHRHGHIAEPLWRDNAATIQGTEAASFPGLHLTTDRHSDPTHTPDESQLSGGYSRDGKQRYLSFQLLPVSHHLDDDNRQYLSENELALFETRLRLRVDSPRVELDHFTLYSIRSLVPWDSLSGGISGRFRLAVEPQWDRELQRRRAAVVDGGLGYSLRLVRDAELYALLGGGTGWRPEGGYLYSAMEAGAVVREIADMKTRVSLVQHYNQLNSGSTNYEARLNQSLFMAPQLTLRFDAGLLFDRPQRRWQAGLELVRLF